MLFSLHDDHDRRQIGLEKVDYLVQFINTKGHNLFLVDILEVKHFLQILNFLEPGRLSPSRWL